MRGPARTTGKTAVALPVPSSGGLLEAVVCQSQVYTSDHEIMNSRPLWPMSGQASNFMTSSTLTKLI